MGKKSLDHYIPSTVFWGPVFQVSNLDYSSTVDSSLLGSKLVFLFLFPKQADKSTDEPVGRRGAHVLERGK